MSAIPEFRPSNCPECGTERFWDIDAMVDESAEWFAWCEQCKVGSFPVNLTKDPTDADRLHMWKRVIEWCERDKPQVELNAVMIPAEHMAGYFPRFGCPLVKVES